MESTTKKQRLGFSISSTKDQVLLVSQLTLFVCLYISFPLWFSSSNFFPRVPVLEFTASFPGYTFFSLTLAVVATLVASIIFPNKKRWITIFLLLFTCSWVFDWMIWQPWGYYYTAFMILLVYSSKEEHSLKLIRFILACIYIFSGLQKFNAGFAFDTFPWLIQPITQHLNEGFSGVLNQTFFAAAIIEFCAGVGLLFARTQRISKGILVAMHLFILAMLGPFGQNANEVVWPWNISFIILLLILFRKKNMFSIASFFQLNMGLKKYVVIILFALLPILSFFNLWPLHFSSALYSGNKVRSEVFLPESIKNSFPENIQAKISEFENGITLNSWAQEELRVAMIPEKKVHLQFFSELCGKYPEFSQEIVMVIYDRPDIFTGERIETTLFCEDLVHKEN